MAVPPQYPELPYPPPPFAYGPPQPPRVPGLTTTAVVLLWVRVGLVTLGMLALVLVAAFQSDFVSSLFTGLGPMLPVLIGAMVTQGLAWSALRAYLAVRIARRSASARTAAIVVEAVGMAFDVAFAVVMFSAVTADPPDGGFRFNFDCTGIIMSILVICFLSTTRSRQWCDR